MPGIRPDARCVLKARRLIKPCQKVTWHTGHIIRVTWHTRHIIILLQDCSRGLHFCVSTRYIGHSDASTRQRYLDQKILCVEISTKSIVSIDSFLSIIKSILVPPSKSLSPSHNNAKRSNFFRPESALLPIVLHPTKGLNALSYDNR